jgi:hypothetical protein
MRKFRRNLMGMFLAAAAGMTLSGTGLLAAAAANEVKAKPWNFQVVSQPCSNHQCQSSCCPVL